MTPTAVRNGALFPKGGAGSGGDSAEGVGSFTVKDLMKNSTFFDT